MERSHQLFPNMRKMGREKKNKTERDRYVRPWGNGRIVKQKAAGKKKTEGLRCCGWYKPTLRGTIGGRKG